QRLQLVDGRGAIYVGGNEKRTAALLAQMERQLAGHRRLTGALQADEHDDGRGLRPEVEATWLTKRLHELVMHNLDHLLARRQAAHDFLPDGALANTADEVLDDLEVDVGLKQGQTNLTHSEVYVSFRQFAALLQVVENRL